VAGNVRTLFSLAVALLDNVHHAAIELTHVQGKARSKDERMMRQIRVVDEGGQPIRYAYLEDENLKFEFEYYATDSSLGYELIQTVLPADFVSIATMFGADPTDDILTIVQEISDSGRGGDLVNALNDKEIRNDLHKWGATS
jgi:hypothetical protein